mmetsp:Transcript_119575/g.372570  ORF Transcript_119575/g.372570 Transcript_119575/m.372570 type:complete len:255 (+) Transcript_119575:129-893(+)
MVPISMLCRVLRKAEMPETSTWLPKELLRAVRPRGSLTSSVRWARIREPTSMASARKPPAPKASTESTSKIEMLAFRTASAMASCSAGPLGEVRLAPLPLLFMVEPARVPMNVSFSGATPSTASASIVIATAPTPSARTKPAAEALKVKHRPSRERALWAQSMGQLIGARQMWAPMARPQSFVAERPFRSIASAARWMAVLPEEDSVSRVMLGPFMPRVKENRPELILRAPPVAPKAPESSLGTLFHSLFPQPT